MAIPATSETLCREGLVPLIVGVTGHRDLVDSEIDSIREKVRGLLLELRERFPDRPLEILSPLAEGADRLVAEIALELGLRLSVPLPMPRDLYTADFETEASRKHFDYLCDRADSVYDLPIVGSISPERLSGPGAYRNLQYAQLGVFLCAHSHVARAMGQPALQ